jgi:long-subunit fatty acid transport protein
VLKDAALRTSYEANLRSQVRAEGATFNRDLPANLGLGAAYQVLPALRTDLSFNYYFNSLAGWDGAEDEVDDGWEVSLAGEYTLSPAFSPSLGAQYTSTGAGPDTYQTENPALDSYSLAGGGRFTLRPGVIFNFGITGNFAWEDDAQVPNLGTANLRKQVWVYAIGVQYQPMRRR